VKTCSRAPIGELVAVSELEGRPTDGKGDGEGMLWARMDRVGHKRDIKRLFVGRSLNSNKHGCK
jgi:hypothetical protein